MKTNVICFLFIFCLCSVQSFNFSKRFKVCYRNDAQMDLCLADAIENGFKTIGSTGLPSIKVPSIDPLKISKLTIGAGTGPVNLVQKYHDVKILGLATLKVENAHLDLEKLILSFSLRHSLVKQEAQYDINGKILVLPVFGNGYSAISFINPVMKHIIGLKEERKNNKKYFKTTNYNLTILPEGLHFDLKNLFNGDKALGDNILKVVNENWEVLFQDVKGGIENAYSQALRAVADSFFSKVPVDDMLPN